MSDTPMKKLMIAAACLTLASTSAFAVDKLDAQPAIDALNESIALAEKSIQLARGQEALNQLHASVAQAELSIAVATAEQVIRDGQAQEAINMLTASVANAELSIALADANQLIDSVSDEQMLAELDMLMRNDGDTASMDMVMAVVSERPELAANVIDVAVAAGQKEELVTASVLSVLGDLPATAAGK